jgi:hypothetical protein
LPELKLPKLPDRTPTKITFTASAELNQALGQYAEMYRAAYGQLEPVAELIPFMLQSFLESDREFARVRRNGAAAVGKSSRTDAGGQAPAAAHISIGKET